MSTTTIATVDSLTDHIVRAIGQATIDTRPYPHITIAGLLPEDIFEAVRREVPDRARFDKVKYPGTGFGRGLGGGAQYDYGYAYKDLSAAGGALALLHAAFASPAYADALFRKFSAPLPDGSTPIPQEKHRFFSRGARDHSTVFDLQIDLPGYAIPPHPDVPEKIVTFQLYLTNDTSLADFGTLLCSPKDDDQVRRGRSAVARRTAGLVSAILPRWTSAFQRLERSRFGAWSGLGHYKNWYPWSWFTVVTTAKALPNHFLAFAPNARSFHAVDLDLPPNMAAPERPVVRGFIRSGQNTKNWISKATM